MPNDYNDYNADDRMFSAKQKENFYCNVRKKVLRKDHIPKAVKINCKRAEKVTYSNLPDLDSYCEVFP